jgi:hypothetical protein
MNIKGENGKHNHDYPVMRSELTQVCYETMDMLNGMRIVINTHAEIMMLHRFLLERFIPGPVLEAAVNEYSKMREEQIAAEAASANMTSEGAPVADAQAN